MCVVCCVRAYECMFVCVYEFAFRSVFAVFFDFGVWFFVGENTTIEWIKNVRYRDVPDKMMYVNSVQPFPAVSRTRGTVPCFSCVGAHKFRCVCVFVCVFSCCARCGNLTTKVFSVLFFFLCLCMYVFFVANRNTNTTHSRTFSQTYNTLRKITSVISSLSVFCFKQTYREFSKLI